LTIRFGPITRAVSTRKVSTVANPIAARGISSQPFVREANELEGVENPPDDKVLIAKAWAVSPEKTVCALAQAGYQPKQIAGLLGYRSDDPKFMSLLTDSRNQLKSEIAAEFTELFEGVVIPVIDSDGITEHAVDVTDKLKKAVVAAFFSGSDEVKFSAMKGAPFTSTLSDIFMEADIDIDVPKEKARMKEVYGRTFRTKDRSAGPIERPLPPALAGLTTGN